MNNPNLAIDQFIQLQNIAYVKQFMQRGAIKVLFIVSLVLAIANGLLIYSFRDFYQMLFEFLQAFSGSATEESIVLSQIMDSSILISSIATIVLKLILPVSLLYIIIRSKSEDPSVIPLGTVKFLYVISFIQSVLVIAMAIISVCMQVLSIFAADNLIESIISTSISAVSLLLACLYYILQTKFLKAFKHSCTGYSLIYGSTKGFGVMAVLYSVFVGLTSAASLIFYIIFYSLLSSDSFDTNNSIQEFFVNGGLEVLETLKPAIIMFIVISLLTTLYYALVAGIAFSYKEMVEVAVRESFLSSKRTAMNANSALRTYGGKSSYSNYNYTSSSASSQQSYAHAAMNNNSANTTVNTTPELNKDLISDAPINESYNSYNNAPQQYDEPIGNGSFTPTHSINNDINNEPFTNGSFGSGSFGFQEDSSNNY